MGGGGELFSSCLFVCLSVVNLNLEFHESALSDETKVDDLVTLTVNLMF